MALLGNNNRYVNSQNGTKALTCNSRSVGGWEAFEWIDINGKYVSSEGAGNKGINCNREKATGGWEQFTLINFAKVNRRC